MDRVTKFFIQNFLKFAGVFSDKEILSDFSISDFEKAANHFGYEYIDLGDNFVVAKARYC